MKNKLVSSPIKFLTILGVSTSAWAYVVKKGDTLSFIAHKNISSKVYGINGSLRKLISLNPEIKNPNLIKPGQYLNLKDQYQDDQLAKREKPKVERFIATEEVEVQNVAESNIKSGRRGIYVLSPFYALGSITSKDKSNGSESTLASNYNTGVVASYIQEWSPDFQTAMNLKLAMIGFEKPVSSSKSLQETSKFVSSLGIETQHALNEKMRLKLNADYGKELFVRAASTQVIATDAISVGSIGAKVTYDLKNLNPFLLGVGTSYKLKLPAKTDIYTVKLGHEVGANLYLAQLNGQAISSSFQTELGFTYRKQDTNLTTQSETNVMLGVKFFFSAGK